MRGAQSAYVPRSLPTRTFVAVGGHKLRAIIFSGFGLLLSLTSSWAEGAMPPISSGTYRALTCAQIVQEARSLSRRGFEMSGLPPGTGGTDSTGVKSAVIIIWPATPTATAGTLSSLRYAASQMDALEQASIESQCSIDFQRPAKTYPG
jgi:hypothetical protein